MYIFFDGNIVNCFQSFKVERGEKACDFLHMYYYVSYTPIFDNTLAYQIPHYLFAANLAVLTHATEVNPAYDVDFAREKVTSPKSVPGGCAIALGT